MYVCSMYVCMYVYSMYVCMYIYIYIYIYIYRPHLMPVLVLVFGQTKPCSVRPLYNYRLASVMIDFDR